LIDHLGFEVADIERSARFYDAIFFALGKRRAFESERAIAWGDNKPVFWVVQRDNPPAPGYGHVALRAISIPAVHAAWEAGLVHGGRADGDPGPRPQYGAHHYAGYLLDPDGLRVEIVTGSR
jgi:catechol 2,3-dioxygenase-like lactoylglutathione lyase family enzyme